MSPQSRVWRGLYGGCWLALLSVALLCLVRGAALPLLSDEVGGGRGWWLLLWLLLGIAVAIPRSDHHGWSLIAALSGGLFLACGGLGLRPGASHTGIGAAMALFALASVCLWCAWRLHQWRPGKRRPARLQRPPRANDRVRFGQWPVAAAWIAASLAIVSSFLLAWQLSLIDRDRFAAAAFVLLMVLFLALPAVGLLHWRPRIAALGLAVAGLMCAFVPLPATAHLVTIVALAAASVAAWVRARRMPMVAARA